MVSLRIYTSIFILLAVLTSCENKYKSELIARDKVIDSLSAWINDNGNFFDTDKPFGGLPPPREGEPLLPYDDFKYDDFTSINRSSNSPEKYGFTFSSSTGDGGLSFKQYDIELFIRSDNVFILRSNTEDGFIGSFDVSPYFQYAILNKWKVLKSKRFESHFLTPDNYIVIISIDNFPNLRSVVWYKAS